MLRLGIDLFSIRSQGWDAFQFLDFASRQGVEVVHFSEPRFVGSHEESHLRQVKARADELRLALEYGYGCICPTSIRFNAAAGPAEDQLVGTFRVAKALGSPIVRVFVGDSRDRSGPIEKHIESTVKVLRAVRSRTLDAGLKIAIENHAGDLQAREMRMLIEEAGRDWVGSCLDSGNPVWALEDPHLTLETLAPYVLTSHIRDSAVWEEERGICMQWTAMGEGSIGMDRWVKRYGELCSSKPLSLEIIVTRQPRVHNYLDPAFWDNFRTTPASEFARFLRLAKQGKPHYPPNPANAVEDERTSLERSIRYTKGLLK